MLLQSSIMRKLTSTTNYWKKLYTCVNGAIEEPVYAPLLLEGKCVLEWHNNFSLKHYLQSLKIDNLLSRELVVVSFEIEITSVASVLSINYTCIATFRTLFFVINSWIQGFYFLDTGAAKRGIKIVGGDECIATLCTSKAIHFTLWLPLFKWVYHKHKLYSYWHTF